MHSLRALVTADTMNDKDTIELKRGAGYLKEKFIIGLSRVTGHELDRAIMKVTSHMLKAPKDKHMQRLLAATYGHYKNDNFDGRSVCGYILSELEKRLHTHNWIVVLKTLVTLHRLMADGFEEINSHILRNRKILCVENIKDLSETVEGSAQNAFIREYLRYLEERVCSQGVIGISNRIESPEFSSVLRSLDANSLVPFFESLLSQLDVLLGVTYRESIVDNFCTLEAYQRLVDDGRILYQLLSNRVIFILDGFSDFSLHLKKVWLKLCQRYVDVGERLRLMFDLILNSCRVFTSPPPHLKRIPETLLKHLEDDVYLNTLPRECVTETLESLGITNDDGKGSSKETVEGNLPMESTSSPGPAALERPSEGELNSSAPIITTSSRVIEKKEEIFSMDDLFVTTPLATTTQAAPCISNDHLAGGSDPFSPREGDKGLDALGFVNNNNNSAISTNELLDKGWSTGAPPSWEIDPPAQHPLSPQCAVLPHAEWTESPSSLNENGLGRGNQDVFKKLYADGQKGWYSKDKVEP